MPHSVKTRHACPMCGQPMEQRERGPAQAELAREDLCRNMDCSGFGIFKRMGNGS